MLRPSRSTIEIHSKVVPLNNSILQVTPSVLCFRVNRLPHRQTPALSALSIYPRRTAHLSPFPTSVSSATSALKYTSSRSRPYTRAAVDPQPIQSRISCFDFRFLPPFFRTPFHFPYPLSSFLATLTETPGVHPLSSRFGPHRSSTNLPAAAACLLC